MPVFDRYIFRNLLLATTITAVTLAAIILLTQSLRFLELVINSGASGTAFWILTLLALPRFFEIILPIALMIATIFIYNRMTMDSELTVMRALGAPPLDLARPALVLALLSTLILWFMTSWLAPVSLSSMHHMRQIIKAQYSTLLFREGIFNNVRPGLTVFVRARSGKGELRGLMIHDSRKENPMPVTVLAKRGEIVSTDEGQQVLVYEGSRQDVDPDTGVLNRLEFERYTIDLPEGSGPVRQRWREPDERTLPELFHPDLKNSRDLESQRAFMVEAHRRIVSPLLAPAFTLLALAVLLVGPVDRRGQTKRIALAVVLAILIQALYLAAFNYARNSNIGLVLMYILVFCPILAGSLILSGFGEEFRRRTFYSIQQENAP
jgi:lipopolysaccharide export system permease protein